MTRPIRHPFNRHRYRAEGPDRVRVETENEWGLFNGQGDWIEGPFRQADPTFCMWITSGWVLENRAKTAANAPVN